MSGLAIGSSRGGVKSFMAFLQVSGSACNPEPGGVAAGARYEHSHQESAAKWTLFPLRLSAEARCVCSLREFAAMDWRDSILLLPSNWGNVNQP